MMKQGLLTILLLTGLLLPLSAQKISVERFKKVKKDPLNLTPLPVDKQQATRCESCGRTSLFPEFHDGRKIETFPEHR